MGSSFRENLREELDFRGMTVRELADRTGISKRSIENYFSKRESIPPADYAVRIAEVLDVSVEYLVTGHDRNESPLPPVSRKILEFLRKCTPAERDAVLLLVEKLAAQH